MGNGDEPGGPDAAATHSLDADLIDHLRAGAAVHNAGFHHAAHDAWEAEWLEREDATADLLQGLIQFSAAVHHARNRNWSGATGLAERAREYLDGAPEHDTNAAAVRSWLGRLAADPALIEREPVPDITVDDDTVTLGALEFPAAGIAARVLGEAVDREELLDAAVAYAAADLPEDPTSPFVSLVLDFLTDPNQGVVLARLEDHVRRRRQRARDVDGLFD